MDRTARLGLRFWQPDAVQNQRFIFAFAGVGRGNVHIQALATAPRVELSCRIEDSFEKLEVKDTCWTQIMNCWVQITTDHHDFFMDSDPKPKLPALRMSWVGNAASRTDLAKKPSRGSCPLSTSARPSVITCTWSCWGPGGGIHGARENLTSTTGIDQLLFWRSFFDVPFATNWHQHSPTMISIQLWPGFLHLWQLHPAEVACHCFFLPPKRFHNFWHGSDHGNHYTV